MWPQKPYIQLEALGLIGLACTLQDHASERPGQQGSSVAAAHQLPRQSLLDGGLHGNHPTADDGGSSALARRIDWSLQISGGLPCYVPHARKTQRLLEAVTKVHSVPQVVL